ncbi:VOC family protein [Sinimarinibacterium sp. CAU 1509]|uniref:VOC family protein n=1 Tax=Sinimarinibacterium sp. CAU 1509 TaxID=2562283 RepID=UPI0010AC62E4|nr:VOC family protein [Sinimarinibacterium sp. CAU 1509]TJY62006.1 VOC family protein [Sinimarinibacterium sp. CAU 1509]
MDLIANIDIDDLARGIRFYCDGLGLSVRRRFGESGVELEGASAALFLLVKPVGSRPLPQGDARRDYQRHWTPVHLDFVVEDLDGAIERALAGGGALESAQKTHRWGRIAQLSDPFGHGICLIQFLNRGYDEIAADPD